jgi:hypothetical protein
MIKDFVPARTSLSTGITISSPVLERNKWSYANPSSTNEIEVMDANLEGPTITTEYTDLYQGLTGSKAPYYTGEFSGSVIEYGDDWIERNFNPYLHPTASLTSSINAFNHSEFNVLLNNVSASRLSITRQDIEFIYGTTGSILTPAYLQDTNESLTTYNRARYEGTKVSSLLYSVYTSASANYSGDSSYGKTAAINKDVRKLGLFTDIVASPLLPGRNRVALKYLVDEFGDLTELNQRNKNWEEVQRTFIAGNYLNVSQFDNQKSSNQKSTDGNKLIFDSGYSYNPILYFVTCSATDPKIYFENLSGASSYRATAKNGTLPLTISGSSPLGYPISASYVPNIFNTLNDTAGAAYFKVGTLNSHPSYSVQETGEHSIQASFDMTVELIGTSQSATWSLQVFRNNEVSPLYESEQIFSTDGPGGTISRRVLIDYTVSTSATNTILVQNSTNANTVSVSGQSRGSIFISIPNNGSSIPVTFTISKTAPTPNASDSGTAQLTLDAIEVDSFPITINSLLSGTLTANISNTEVAELKIYEG